MASAHVADGPEVEVHDSAGAAVAAAARHIAQWTRHAAQERGAARLAVSGGSTPSAMFRAMAEMDLPWDRVELFQVDERVAPDGDPDRNATDLRAELVARVPIPVQSVHMMPVTAPDLAAAAAAYAAELGPAPLDIVHLGIGDDGHTASWPPGDPVADEAVPVAVSAPFNGRVRMTLTPSVVNSALRRLVLVCGAAKAPALARWLDGNDELPISRVTRAGTLVVADVAATGRRGRQSRHGRQ